MPAIDDGTHAFVAEQTEPYNLVATLVFTKVAFVIFHLICAAQGMHFSDRSAHASSSQRWMKNECPYNHWLCDTSPASCEPKGSLYDEPRYGPHRGVLGHSR